MTRQSFGVGFLGKTSEKTPIDPSIDVQVIRVRPNTFNSQFDIDTRSERHQPNTYERPYTFGTFNRLSYLQVIQGFDKSISFYGRMSAFNPAAYQSAMGGASSYTLNNSYVVEYRHYFTERVFILARLNNYATQGIINGDSSINYSVSGYGLNGGVGMTLLDTENNRVGVSIGFLGGGNYSSARNSNQYFTLNSSILSYSVSGLLMFHFYVVESLGLNLNLGYAYNPLGNISTLTHRIVSNSAAANIDMSTPLAELGLSYRF